MQEGQYESSVPAVRDRIVQAAAKIVLEPVFEADFLPCSFGFRPGLSAHDALQVLIDECWQGNRWVVETDIASCFSAIPHEKLMEAVEERICDQPVLKLLRAMLRAGVMEDGQVRRPVTGTPQGGVISPVMCNVYLHRLDRAWDDGGRGSGALCRRPGCDVPVPQPGRTGAGAPDGLLAALGLEPKAAKTRIVHLEEGGEGLTSSASTTAWCGRKERPGNAGSFSLPAGPRTRPCSTPATGSAR